MRGALRPAAIEMGLQHSAHTDNARWAVQLGPFVPQSNAIVAAARLTEISPLENNFDHWNHMS